ncbi:hypothetical protein K402DRAFT_406060 [Aulographum hederae CBS 113979]|uniref:Elongin-A n=1 Tax=Aulographum hederae CBS 113979 TaxID=1176131 RepID=A0A6G1GUG2_9PEZI|nr:hypothetical protein K402DRAFT_406060 [Aulographum hederae CBS 113979]
MPARPLRSMCISRLQKIADLLSDVGTLPYSFVRPILLKVENPDVLRKLEIASPQLQGCCGEIWISYIKRDVQNWQKKLYEPSDPRDWHEVYQKLLRENAHEDELAIQIMLKAKQDAEKQQAAHRVGIVPPTYTAARRATPGSKPTRALRPEERTGVRGVINNMKRNRVGLSDKGRLAKMETPSHLLKRGTPATQQIPKSMRHEKIDTRHYTAPSNAAVSALKMRNKNRERNPQPSTAATDLKAKEARLLAIQQGKPLPPSPPQRPSTPANSQRKDFADARAAREETEAKVKAIQAKATQKGKESPSPPRKIAAPIPFAARYAALSKSPVDRQAQTAITKPKEPVVAEKPMEPSNKSPGPPMAKAHLNRSPTKNAERVIIRKRKVLDPFAANMKKKPRLH